MRTIMSLAACALTLAFVLSPGRAMAQDSTVVAPDVYTVIFENDRVRLLEYRAQPGVKSPMHSHPESLSYALTDGKWHLEAPDGSFVDAETNAGSTFWQGPTTHSAENTGTTVARGLMFEIK